MPAAAENALSGSPPISTLSGVPGKFLQQLPRHRWSHKYAPQDFPAELFGAAHSLVSAAAGLHDGAIHAGPGTPATHYDHILRRTQLHAPTPLQASREL
jgi:hypothetical protein